MTEKLMQLVAKIAAEHQLIVTVDPSPRNPLPWAGVSLVKPNRLEAFAAAGLEDHLLPGPPLENRSCSKSAACCSPNGTSPACSSLSASTA
jgi:hypothetical protein